MRLNVSLDRVTFCVAIEELKSLFFITLKLKTRHIQVDLIETLAGELIHLEQSFNIVVVMVVKVSSTGSIKPHLQV
jgi:hypothetical protein